MRLRIVIAFALGVLAAASSAAGQERTVNPAAKLHWRSVGPFIGGRVVAVAGVPTESNLFYMGAVDGGIWKSTDYGIKWVNISDGTLPGDSNSIGALAAAPSNPNVIWAGTGESDIRGDMVTGDGMFRSTDAGKSWNYAGLRDTHTTSGIAIDPRDPNVVYVASMGHVFVPGADRGVYKTTDGGKTWRKALFVNDATGAIALSMDLKHPGTLYAAMWQAQRMPWKLISGGAGSGLYKTTDGGAHWKNLSTTPGYPRGVLGRIGVSVSLSRPSTVYSIVQAKAGGIFRSDNGGLSWRRVNEEMELRQRAFYYTSIFVDPKSADTIYVPNVAALWMSRDAGRTFRAPAPHGDNHVVWVNPHNTKIMLDGNDGGATVSTDGGETWSSEQNQPTGQFYHVSIDDRFPFHIYGAQQDEGSIEGPSASAEGAIAESAWQRAAYGESTFVAPQPGDPNVTYGSGYFSIFLQYDAGIGQYRSVSPWPNYQEGAASDELKYRFGWTHPILFSPANPKELLVGSQYVLKSDDYGRTWQRLSPDLTRNDPSTEGPTGGPVDLDQTSAEVYPDVSALAVSPLDNGVIWAGSADGLIHVTTDGGAHWTAVTPPALPQTAQISSIEPSHVAKGAAYVTASRYMWDDFRPYVYETSDYGAHWTAITADVPADQYAFVVRQDPTNANLLFLGTKSSVYVSLNGGASWQPLALNLPKVQVRDIAIDTRQGEVVAATHGRAFWALDSLALLEQLARNGAAASDGVQVFAPQIAWLTHAYGASTFPQSGAGENPPFGATVFFTVPSSYSGTTPVTLTFSDASGSVVRTFGLHLKTHAPRPPAAVRKLFTPAETQRRAELERTGIEPGANRFLWDLRYPDATDVTGFNQPIAAGGEEDAVSGPVVLPGTYRVTLSYGALTARATLDVALDPRIHVAADALAARFALEQRIHSTLDSLDRRVNEALALRARLEPIAAARAQARSALAALDSEVSGAVQLESTSSEGPLLYETKLRDHLAYLAADVELAYDRPTPAQYAVFDELAARASSTEAKLDAAIAQGKQTL